MRLNFLGVFILGLRVRHSDVPSSSPIYRKLPGNQYSWMFSHFQHFFYTNCILSSCWYLPFIKVDHIICVYQMNMRESVAVYDIMYYNLSFPS